MQAPGTPEIQRCDDEIAAEQHPLGAIMRLLGKCSGENRGAGCNVKTNDLEKHQTERYQDWMSQMRFEQKIEDNALGEGEEVVGEEPIENDLPLSKWAGEKKLDVRRLEDQSALRKPFEE